MKIKFENLNLTTQKPLYLQLTDIIEKKIINKEIVIGEKLPPQEDLRKMFHVSRGTMGDAIAKLVQKGYLATRSNYGTFVISSEPNRAMDFKTRNEVGVIICVRKGNTNAFFNPLEPRLSEFFTRIEKTLREKGKYLVYITTDDTPNLFISEKEKDLAGIILMGSITRGIMNSIKKTQLPSVMIGDLQEKQITEEVIDVIAEDDFQCHYIATKYLIESGRKNIVFLSSYLERFSWNINNLGGYKQALKDAGIAFNQEFVIEAKGFEQNHGYRAMKDFLNKSIAVDGLVGFSSKKVFSGAIGAIVEKGLKIPEDIDIVSDEESEVPSFMKIDYDAEELIRLTVERLFKQMETPGIKPVRLVVPGKLVKGSSIARVEEDEYAVI